MERGPTSVTEANLSASPHTFPSFLHIVSTYMGNQIHLKLQRKWKDTSQEQSQVHWGQANGNYIPTTVYGDSSSVPNSSRNPGAAVEPRNSKQRKYFYCGGPRHHKKDCRKRQRKMQQGKLEPHPQIFASKAIYYRNPLSGLRTSNGKERNKCARPRDIVDRVYSFERSCGYLAESSGRRYDQNQVSKDLRQDHLCMPSCLETSLKVSIADRVGGNFQYFFFSWSTIYT
ncbi:hypothetical protein K450DRAFT_244512 [Umbelopsis ramanniana AG]|uniref:Uncharacterized protein n=1 Tax=Umbelopsis ramanniana AG TaxID=1314678 RepID=A0AAD5HDI4_UMBRA|nr:uncharacterized protein K450DRAFT_244512 [Umbelopsis ramanniana AG]KAI8578999.1 hypothetical protein K450DRAFT_244512 [Umbelopsis ramanniana AG]